MGRLSVISTARLPESTLLSVWHPHGGPQQSPSSKSPYMACYSLLGTFPYPGSPTQKAVATPRASRFGQGDLPGLAMAGANFDTGGSSGDGQPFAEDSSGPGEPPTDPATVPRDPPTRTSGLAGLAAFLPRPMPPRRNLAPHPARCRTVSERDNCWCSIPFHRRSTEREPRSWDCRGVEPRPGFGGWATQFAWPRSGPLRARMAASPC